MLTGMHNCTGFYGGEILLVLEGSRIEVVTKGNDKCDDFVYM